jgi:hypothetical protein
MSSIDAVAMGTAIFLAEWVVRYWLMSKTEEAGHVVAWGVVRGIKLSQPERARRLWGSFFPHLTALCLLPIAVGMGLLQMATIAADLGGGRVLYLYAFLEMFGGVATIPLVALHFASLAKRVRAGQLGFVASPDPG